MQHTTGDCVWYVISSYKYCSLSEPVEEASGLQRRCKKSSVETIIKLAKWGSFIFFLYIFYFPISWNKHNIIFLLFKGNSMHSSYFCTDSCCVQLRCGRRSRSSAVYSWLRHNFFQSNSWLCLPEEAFFGLFWDRQQPSCTKEIEKGRKSNAWMIERERVNFQSKTSVQPALDGALLLCISAIELCWWWGKYSQDNKKHYMSVVKPCTNTGTYQPFYYRYECCVLSYTVYSYKAFSQQKKEWKQEENC